MSTHNLDVSMYTLDELLGLFDLTYDITPDGIKKAKHKVLMIHPDKSKLPADYFIFYKKAFEIVVGFYEEQSRHNKPMPTEPVIYSDIKSANKNTKRIINEMKKSEFNTQFNTMSGSKRTSHCMIRWRICQLTVLLMRLNRRTRQS